MSNGLNRDDMNWINRDCKERATIVQLWAVVFSYQEEIKRRDIGADSNDTEDIN